LHISTEHVYNSPSGVTSIEFIANRADESGTTRRVVESVQRLEKVQNDVLSGKEAIGIFTRVRVAVGVSGSLNFVDLRQFRRIGLNACPLYYSSPVYTELLIRFSYTKFSEDEVKEFD
jgi:hypothetical protein